MNSDFAPGRPQNVPLGIPARREAARITRFWRRFHRSKLRETIRETENLDRRFALLEQFMNRFGARYPSLDELNMLGGWMKQWGPGGDGEDLGEALELADMVMKFLPLIPESVMKFASIPDHRTFVASDDDAVNMEVVAAGLNDPMPRERFSLPKAIRLERRVRGGLTKWEWQVPEGESPKANVQFLIDSSGSMDLMKLALAIAAAMKLEERISAQGHSVSLRFVAYKHSDRMGPVDAIKFATSKAKRELGGGDWFGAVLKELDVEEPTVTDWVIFSDFNIRHYALGESAMTVVWPKAHMHCVKIEYGEEDASAHSPWYQKGTSRHDFSKLFQRLGGDE